MQNVGECLKLSVGQNRNTLLLKNKSHLRILLSDQKCRRMFGATTKLKVLVVSVPRHSRVIGPWGKNWILSLKHEFKTSSKHKNKFTMWFINLFAFYNTTTSSNCFVNEKAVIVSNKYTKPRSFKQ